MPYAWVNVAAGHSAENKRTLIRSLTNTFVNTLEVGSAHTQVYVVETALDNIGIAGEEPDIADVALVTVMLSRGRPPVVLQRLINDITNSVAQALSLSVDDVHCVLLEQDASQISVGGSPLGFPKWPRWLLDDSTKQF